MVINFWEHLFNLFNTHDLQVSHRCIVVFVHFNMETVEYRICTYVCGNFSTSFHMPSSS